MHKRPNEPKFICYVTKPKAKRIFDDFLVGCRRQGFECVVTDQIAPRPGWIGVFYGVTPETYAAFQYYRAEGRAIYLDNGWLSVRERPTFRFTWNAAQTFLYDMEPVRRLAGFPDLPTLERVPQRDLALLVLQSPQYFQFLRLPYTQETWIGATTRLLESRGYRVEQRAKPRTKDPNAETFFDQMNRAGIVVSLNSAACLKALRWGIPAYCTLDCTLSPLAPVKLPRCGMAGAARKEDVEDMCKRIARYEFDRSHLLHGDAAELFLSVPQQKRRGYWYGP